MGDKYRRTLSAGSVIGTNVVNSQGEDLGSIEELMINVETGEVAYAVLSFGGFMGMGDKLFAVPWRSLVVDENEEQIILNRTKKELEMAPGFDKDHWPDFSADSLFSGQVRDFYGKASGHGRSPLI